MIAKGNKMSSILDWVISILGLDLVNTTEDYPEYEAIVSHSGRDNKKNKGRIYYKVLLKIEDANALIDEYKAGTVCMFALNNEEKAQEIYSYVNGAVYAFEGEMICISNNIYIVMH